MEKRRGLHVKKIHGPLGLDKMVSCVGSLEHRTVQYTRLSKSIFFIMSELYYIKIKIGTVVNTKII